MALTEQAYADGVFNSEMSVKDIMDTWTLQMGFPVVEVLRNNEQNSATLTQKKFVLDSTNNASKYLWWIPITYMQSDKKVKSSWMKAETSTVIHDIETKSWLLLNVDQTGYYRVNYDQENWNQIIDALNEDHHVFDPKNRAQLIDDSLSLASAGYLDYDVALNITKYLNKERDYVPWKAAFTSFNYLNYMFMRAAHYDSYKVIFYSLTILNYKYDILIRKMFNNFRNTC